MPFLSYNIFVAAIYILLIAFPVLFTIQIIQSIQFHSLLIKKKATSAKAAIKLTEGQKKEFYLALPRISYLKTVFPMAGKDKYWLNKQLWGRGLLTEFAMAIILMGLFYLVVRSYLPV